MALDDATTQLMAVMAQAGGAPLHTMSPTAARTKIGELTSLYGSGPVMARAETLQVHCESHTIPIRVLAPSDRCAGVLVYYHGGGWVLGALAEYEVLGRLLAHRTGCAVVLVDYRLAPEHPYPAAVEDAWTTLAWVGANMDELAGSRVPLIVAGDSAGGNLAAVVSQKARDQGGPPITLQVLVYPVTDSNLDNASYTDAANQLMLNRDTMVWFWDHYVPEHLRLNPDVCPARAADLTGLPPAVVLTAEHDVLRDEGEAYARALASAGVSVTHRRFDGQIHGFFTMVNMLPGSAAGIDFVANEIGRHLSLAHPEPISDRA